MPRSTPPVKINQTKIILAEGADACYFCIWATQAYGRFDIQVMDFGGVGSNDLKLFLRSLQNIEGYDAVDTIVIARDAERDGNAAVESVKYHLGQAGLPVPATAFQFAGANPRCAFMIFPSYAVDATGKPQLIPGTLEDLCLFSVQGDPLLTCVDAYITCAEGVRGGPVIHPHKAKVYSYLACKNDYAGLKLSEAARVGAWDWKHPAFDLYKQIIIAM